MCARVSKSDSEGVCVSEWVECVDRLWEWDIIRGRAVVVSHLTVL